MQKLCSIIFLLLPFNVEVFSQTEYRHKIDSLQRVAWHCLTDLNGENFFKIYDLKDEKGNAAETKVILKIKINNVMQMENVETKIAAS